MTGPDRGGADDHQRAIERVLYRYAHGIDRRDLAVVRDCYWDDAHDEHEGFSGTIDEYCAWLADVLPKVDVSTHVFANVVVDVDSGGDGAAEGDATVARATSDAYCLNTSVWRLADGKERHLMTCLSYIDEWERRAGEWRISRRRCRRLWSRVEEVQPW